MSDPATFSVPVPGATLHCERQGDGPLLLMIAGGLGDAGYYTSVAERLADAYEVVAYDRRGNSRSPLDGDPYMVRIEEQCADALAVIEACGRDRAFVFGNSSGAIIALELAIRHPQAVAGVIAHEPPLVGVLDDAERWRGFMDEVVAQARREGAMAAFGTFASEIGQPEEPVRTPELMARLAGNFDFLLQYEMGPFAHFDVDLEALRESGVPVVLGGGDGSVGRFYYRPAEEIAQRLGARFATFPGHHNGYLDEPDEFAAVIRAELERLGAAVA